MTRSVIGEKMTLLLQIMALVALISNVGIACWVIGLIIKWKIEDWRQYK